MTATQTQPAKQQILFPCCNATAYGFRQCIKFDGVIWNTTKCPRCGKIFKLSEWKKP